MLWFTCSAVSKAGVITERIQRKVKSRTTKEGYAKLGNKVIWDGSNHQGR